jgi:hypothetical protein
MTKKIPQQPLTEDKIRAIMKKAGIKSPSKKSIQLILATIKGYPSNAALETFNSTPIQKKKKNLQSLLEVLEKALEIFKGMSAPMLILPDAMRTDWLITTDKIIKDIKRQIDFIDKIKGKGRAGRKMQFVKMCLVNNLIVIFEDETGKSFKVVYDTYRDVDRREFDKSGMSFLSCIMELIDPELTNDNLRKYIARALCWKKESEDAV